MSQHFEEKSTLPVPSLHLKILYFSFVKVKVSKKTCFFNFARHNDVIIFRIFLSALKQFFWLIKSVEKNIRNLRTNHHESTLWRKVNTTSLKHTTQNHLFLLSKSEGVKKIMFSQLCAPPRRENFMKIFKRSNPVLLIDKKRRKKYQQSQTNPSWVNILKKCQHHLPHTYTC